MGSLEQHGSIIVLFVTVGSLEQHGSIIAHLLSQVRIGMDLTKVVLPTFILERRSLLEMYADFFAHPDLFVKYVHWEHFYVLFDIEAYASVTPSSWGSLWAPCSLL